MWLFCNLPVFTWCSRESSWTIHSLSFWNQRSSCFCVSFSFSFLFSSCYFSPSNSFIRVSCVGPIISPCPFLLFLSTSNTISVFLSFFPFFFLSLSYFYLFPCPLANFLFHSSPRFLVSHYLFLPQLITNSTGLDFDYLGGKVLIFVSTFPIFCWFLKILEILSQFCLFTSNWLSTSLSISFHQWISFLSPFISLFLEVTRFYAYFLSSRYP